MAYAINVIFPKEHRSLEKIATTNQPKSIKTKHQIIQQQIGMDGQQKIIRLIRYDVKWTKMDGSPCRSK